MTRLWQIILEREGLSSALHSREHQKDGRRNALEGAIAL